MTPAELRNKFLAQNGLRYDFEHLPGLGDFWFRSMPETERADFEVEEQDAEDTRTVKRRLIVRCCCEGDGKPDAMFTADDIEQMGEVDSMFIDRLATSIMKHNGIGEEDLLSIVGEPSSSSDSSPSS